MAKKNLKTELCENLIREGKVQEGDIVKHSYTKQIMSGNKKAVEKQDEMITLTTRGDCFGVAVKRYKNYITWKDKQGNFNTECNRASLPNDLALTVATANIGKVIDNAREREREQNNLAIRKLTPCECLKLMGFEKQDYEAMRAIGMTDMQIYHVAGDSIIVNVLMGIFGELLGVEDTKKKINDYTEGLVEKDV